MASRWAPTRWICSCELKSSVLISASLPKYVSPAFATRTSMSPSASTALATNDVIESGSVTSRWKRDGLAAVGADLADELVELVDAAGAEHDGEAAGGELDGGGLADAGGGAGDDGRSTVGEWGETGHHRAFTVMGRWAKPRTLMEWTRTELASSTS